ncbi:MAG: hypothetical protein U1A27_11745 [Phycisphaerae bacterium]
MQHRSRTRWLAVAALVATGVLVPRTRGDVPAPAATQPAGVERIADEQGVILSRLERLEDRLFQLSEALKKSEPEHAARLLDALSTGRTMLLRPRIEHIVADLRAARLPEAADAQQKLAADFDALLKLLMNETSEPRDRRKEADELKALRERIAQLVAEQQAELDAAQRAAAAQQRLAALRALGEQLRQVLSRQHDLSRKSSGANADQARALSPQQRELGSAARALAKALAAPPESASTSQPAGQAPHEATKETPPGKSPSDHKNQTDKPAGPQKPSPPAAPSGAPPSAAMRQASQSADQAADEMRSAADQLSKGDHDGAKQPQSAAAEKLRRAIERLAEEQAELEKQLDYLKQAQAQRDTAGKTRDLAQKMRGGGDQSSGPQKGEKGAEESPGGEGRAESAQKLDQAAPHQNQAAKKLGDKKPDDAARDQREALDKLNQAQQELDDALEQLRREQQEEMLAALETRFAAMLARQTAINADTNRLDAAGANHWSRTDQLALSDAAKSQRWIADEAASALKVLREDATTIVVPQLVEQVRDDATDAAARLAAADTAALTRQLQESIVLTLQELLEAVREIQKKNQEQSESGNPSGSSDQNPPLIPGSAELRLLKSCQQRVNRATDDLERQRVLPGSVPHGLAELTDRLARRQAAVAGMARDLVEGEKKREAQRE